MATQTRQCPNCGQDKELRRRNFRRSKEGVYDTRCRKCRTRQEKARARAAALKRKRSLEAIERSAVDQFLRSVNMGGATVPHTAELLEALMGYFGGVNGLAAMFFKQYCDAPPGGSFRTKMLDTAVRLVSKNTDVGGAKKPLELMTAEEIEAEIDAKIRLAAAAARAVSLPKGLPDASPKKDASGTSAEPVSVDTATDSDGANAGRLPEDATGGTADGTLLAPPGVVDPLSAD